MFEQLSQDEETRLHAEARQMAIMTERISLANAKNEGMTEGRKAGKIEGIKEGVEQAVKKFATKLIQTGMPLEQIAELTELDTDELNELTKSVSEQTSKS